MHLTAAILAGGRSTRFGGRDKSGLVVGGVPILERQIAALSQLTSDILIVGGQTAHERTRTVRDLVPGSGPLGGLHTALHAAMSASQGDAMTVVLACDMPYVTSDLIAHLVALAVETEDDADAVVPRTSRGYHPLCATYTRACLEPITRRLAEGQLRMIELLSDLRVRVVTTRELAAFGDPDQLLANVNTPAEYSSLKGPKGHEL